MAKEYSREVKDRNIFIALILFFITIINRSVLNKVIDSIWVIISIEVFIPILVLMYLIKLDEIKVKEFFKIKNIKYIIFGYLALRTIAIIFSFLGDKIYGNISLNDQYMRNELKNLSNLGLLEFNIYASIWAPIIEEFTYRYVIIGNIGGKRYISSILSSVLFSFGHVSGNILYFLMYFLMGFVLAMIYKKTDKVELCMIIHMLNNTLQ